MKMKQIFTKRRIFFLLIFAALVFIGRRIGFFPVLGAENQSLTFFQFFGPVTGSFLGPVFGSAAVCLAYLTDLLLHGSPVSMIGLLGVLPMMFAAFYFGTKRRAACVLVSLAAMALFLIHPVGRQVWFFSLFWLIPIVAVISKKNSNKLLIKSLGATFTAHAVGTAIWIWMVPMTAGQWISLIPVVMIERMIMTGGIAVSYLLMNRSLEWLSTRIKWLVPQEVVFLNRINESQKSL